MSILKGILRIAPDETVDQQTHRRKGHQEDCQAAGLHGIEASLQVDYQGCDQRENDKGDSKITPLLSIHSLLLISQYRNETQPGDFVAALYIAVPIPHPKPKEKPNAAPINP
jgi:hypothetical protein